MKVVLSARRKDEILSACMKKGVSATRKNRAILFDF
jgi:hypothetical protein